MTRASQYDWNSDGLCAEILAKKYGVVAIQLPEGVKRHFVDIAADIEKKTGALVITMVEPCYGACDIPDSDLKRLGVDFLVQFGHAEIPNLNGKYALPVTFIELKTNLDVGAAVRKALPLLTGKRVGIATPVQHIDAIPSIKKLLADHGFEAVVGKGDTRVMHEGQVLGCNFSAVESIQRDVDSILYVGSGLFHPLGVALAIKKPVVIADPYTAEARTTEEIKERVLRQRFAVIEQAKAAQRFGILIGTKIGQERKDEAVKLKKALEEHGKQAFLLAADRLEPMALDYLGLDAFVSTMCPRIAIDDAARYKKPMLTPIEATIAIGAQRWEEYSFDEIR